MPRNERKLPVEICHPNGVRTWDADKNNGASFKMFGVHLKSHGNVVAVQYSAKLTSDP